MSSRPATRLDRDSQSPGHLRYQSWKVTLDDGAKQRGGRVSLVTQARTTKKVGAVIRDWREAVEGRRQELPSLDFDIQGEAEDGVWHLYPVGVL